MHSDSYGSKEYTINSTETSVCQVLIGKLDFKHFSEDNSQIKFEFQLSPKIATIKNKSELFILAGEADLYLNKVFVGTRRLKDCDRNIEFKLSFGIDRSIQPIEKKFDKIGIFKNAPQILLLAIDDFGYDEVVVYKNKAKVKRKLRIRLENSVENIVITNLSSSIDQGSIRLVDISPETYQKRHDNKSIFETFFQM